MKFIHVIQLIVYNQDSAAQRLVNFNKQLTSGLRHINIGVNASLTVS